MCNIAGYTGNKQAAPILLEMIRKMQPYDGDTAVGIATIHEGKLHVRKFHGTAEDFMKQTDVLTLPGTIGIAHTHPGANPNYEFHHPSLSMNGKMALVANGTMPQTKYIPLWDECIKMLEDAGFHFTYRYKNSNGRAPKLSATGELLAAAEVYCFLTEYYLRKGFNHAEALAKANAAVYSEVVTVMLSLDLPDRIFALRTTRPMEAITENGETYIATTAFAFPETLKSAPFSLPVSHVCSITSQGAEITNMCIEGEPVSEMTPFTYKEAYDRFEKMLTGEAAPLYFDELESAAGKMRDLWEGDHTFVQHAKLTYDLLLQFEKEGRLCREMRVQPVSHGTRRRWYFSLKD